MAIIIENFALGQVFVIAPADGEAPMVGVEMVVAGVRPTAAFEKHTKLDAATALAVGRGLVEAGEKARALEAKQVLVATPEQARQAAARASAVQQMRDAANEN